MKSNPVIKIEYSGKEPASSRANYKKLDRIVDPGFPVDPMGYWNPANIGQIVQVPTEDGNISMEGVNQDLIGMDEYGNTQYQEPGKKYKYRGKFITEYPIAKDGGWLDKYQSKGEVKKDKRKIPQSGMVIDKRTNQAYYFGDKGETGSFPVLTGLNPELNSNTYTPQTLNQNPQLKNTPVGYYMMEQGLPKTPYTNTYYNGRVRPMQPIPAFGMNAPDSEDLSIHNTFSDPNNPSIFNSRNKMYSAPGDKRYVSQGCINCQKESYDAFNKAIPHDDTLMVLDSKKPMDFVLLQQAQARMKKKQYGGWLDTMQDGGINMSKVRMDFHPKSQIEAQEQLDYQTRSELAWQKQQEENKKKSIAEGVKKGIPKKQAEAIALSQENPRDQGEIKENIPQSGLSKFIEIASNPVTAMEDYVRSGYNRLPDHFSSNTDRDMLSPTGIANMGYQFLTPLGRTAWAAQSADNADDAVKAGDYTGAAINAAFVLPGLGEGKKFAQTVNKLNRVKNINNIRKAKNTFTFNPEVLKAQQQSLQEARTLKGLPAGSKVLDEAKKYEEYLAEKNAWHQKAIKEHRLNQEQYLRDSDIKQQNFWEYPPIELEQPRRWEQVPIKDDKRVISSLNFNKQSSGFPPIEDDAFDSVQRVSGFESADMERAIREAEERAIQRDMEAAEARYESNQLQAPPSELHIPGTEEFYNPVSGTYETVFNSNTPDKLRTFAEFNNYYDDLGINKNYVNRVLRHKFGENVSVKTINKLLEKNPDLKVGQINKIHNALQDYMNSYKGSAEIDGVKNRSGISKLVALSTASIKDKEKLSKMSAKDFSQTVLKPTGEIVPYKQAKDLEEIGYNTATRNLQLKNVIPMSNQEYAEVFNERLDLLNDIIKKNNKSGLEYNVKKLSPDGRLIFETPSMPGADQSWQTNINPGQWRGDVEDIANTEYFRSIPGLEMSNTTSSVFGDRQPRKGSRTYESINEYLKSIDLGRVKPGFNSQTTYSKGLWEDAIKKDKAHGFYSNPNTVYGAMKSVLPYVGTGVLGAGALNQEQNGGWLDDEEFRRGGQKGLKKFTSKNIATSVNDIMMRNETLFGKPGKKRYKPGLKFKNGGGWLDNIV